MTILAEIKPKSTKKWFCGVQSTYTWRKLTAARKLLPNSDWRVCYKSHSCKELHFFRIIWKYSAFFSKKKHSFLAMYINIFGLKKYKKLKNVKGINYILMLYARDFISSTYKSIGDSKPHVTIELFLKFSARF